MWICSSKEAELCLFLHRPYLFENKATFSLLNYFSMVQLTEKCSLVNNSTVRVQPILQQLNVRFTKNNTLSFFNHKTTKYSYTLAIPGGKWNMSKSFSHFEKFQAKLLKILCNGHCCKGACPWIFDYVKNHFPRNHFFHSNWRNSGHLELFFNTLLKVARTPMGHCEIAQHQFPMAVISFLYGTVKIESVLNRMQTNKMNTTTDDRSWNLRRSDGSVSSTISDDDLPCCCGDDIVTRRQSTTLECGHRFHDNCIVNELKKAMVCPSCNYCLSKIG